MMRGGKKKGRGGTAGWNAKTAREDAATDKEVIVPVCHELTRSSSIRHPPRFPIRGPFLNTRR